MGTVVTVGFFTVRGFFAGVSARASTGSTVSASGASGASSATTTGAGM
jgi:hypothetical protein